MENYIIDPYCVGYENDGFAENIPTYYFKND